MKILFVFGVCVLASVSGARSAELASGGFPGAKPVVSPGTAFIADGTIADQLTLSFDSTLDVPDVDGLTIDYTNLNVGRIVLSFTPRQAALGSKYTDAGFKPSDVQGHYVTSLYGGEVGFYGGVSDLRSAFALEPVTAWNVGASLGYAGFSVRGGYIDSSTDGVMNAMSSWQAGVAYKTESVGVSLSYVASDFGPGSLVGLDRRKWMVGGIYRISPAIQVDANAFYINRDVQKLALAPPEQTGARVGVRLNF